MFHIIVYFNRDAKFSLEIQAPYLVRKSVKGKKQILRLKLFQTYLEGIQ